jgi:hypothetical protein
VSEAVIGGALLLIAQNRVGLAALLEALFGLGVSGIAVRVKLQRQLAIGALDLAVSRGASDAEYFVVISFYVGSQIRNPAEAVVLRGALPRPCQFMNWDFVPRAPWRLSAHGRAGGIRVAARR